MKIILVIATCLTLMACDFNSKSARELISKRNVVVLARNVVLTEKTLDLRPVEPMKIAGAMSSICFVLKSGVPMQDMSVMDQLFVAAMRGAKINVAIVLSTGTRISLSPPTFSWSGDGEVIKGREELSACAAPPCGTTLPVDAIVNQVEVSSVPDFSVNGIYWKSERDPSEPLVPSLAPSTKTDVASQPVSKTKCSA